MMTLDEFSLIDRYFTSLFPTSDLVRIGPGDDCAVMTVPPDHELCVSTDTLLSGVHFPLSATGDVVAGRTVAANLSDLAAMGATPHSVVLALTLPALDEIWLDAFSIKLKAMLQQFSVPLAGGNMSRGELSLTMTVLGHLPSGEAITRSGAVPGDLVFVTGTLGDAGRGLELLNDVNPSRFLIERYEFPTPRIALGEALRGLASAMVDVSDGLLADAGHVARASQCLIELDRHALPISAPLLESAGLALATRYALTAGDDYELCFTCPQGKRDELIAFSQKHDVPVTQIGRVKTGVGIQIVDEDGAVVPSPESGYRHF